MKGSAACIQTCTSKGRAKYSTRIKACTHGVILNTPPHRGYSSSHGIMLVKAKKAPEVSELFGIQCLCEHVCNIFPGVNIGEL